MTFLRLAKTVAPLPGIAGGAFPSSWNAPNGSASTWAGCDLELGAAETKPALCEKRGHRSCSYSVANSSRLTWLSPSTSNFSHNAAQWKLSAVM